MANSKDSGTYREYATVNEAPGADGYFTNVVGFNRRDREEIFFSVRETGDSDSFTVTITLQFLCPGDDEWATYQTYTTEDRKVITMGGAGVQWRAGVLNGDYTEGTVSFGFDW